MLELVVLSSCSAFVKLLDQVDCMWFCTFYMYSCVVFWSMYRSMFRLYGGKTIQRSSDPEPCCFGTCVAQEISQNCQMLFFFWEKVRKNRWKWPKQALPCHNLGRCKTDNWQIITKFLIHLVHREFNFRSIWTSNCFEKITSSPSFRRSKIGHCQFQISVVDNQNPY